MRQQGSIPDDLSQLEDRAAQVLEPESLAYILAGAGNRETTRANAAAFRQWRVKRRRTAQPPARDLSTTVLGTRMRAPVLFAPVGVQKLAHPEGELASARAAADLKLTYIHSTQASYSTEEVAAANGEGSRWYQLYWPRDDELTVSFLRRAGAAGYTHLVITLDTTQLGWRPLDLDRGYSPFLANLGIANYTTDPVFTRRLTVPADQDPVAAGIAFAGQFQNPGLSWKQLPLIRRNWDGPILLKGIQSVRDAKLAAKHGIDGIVVSNHGGRQVDGAIASLDALPPIVDAVGDRLAVLFDSGIRTGVDAYKALALGADAVLIGRPYVYGLALDGQAGVARVMRTLLAELDRTLARNGYRSHRQAQPGLTDQGSLSERPRACLSTPVASSSDRSARWPPPPCSSPGALAAGRPPSGIAHSAQVGSPAAPSSYYGYQSEIYLRGMAQGQVPKVTTNLVKLEARAAKVLDRRARRYFLAGSGGETAARANARAFRGWRIVPRMFIDRAERDLSTTILGTRMPAPVIFAPVGRQKLAHADGELASARAAAGLELTYIQSSRASYPIEEIAAANGEGTRWYQMDWPGDGDLNLSSLRRARAAGCTHLLITAPRAGRSWRPLRRIRKAWDGPIILRGVQTAMDARLAAKRGFDGIVVSNYGGRRGNPAAGSVHALPKIVDAVGDRLAVLFDSGVRTGTDTYKALALGADAILVGRPYVYGLALDGQAGVSHVMRTLLAEFDLNMANAGYRSHRKLSRADLVRVRA